MSEKPKLTDSKEFATIRSIYFDPAEPQLKDMDEQEYSERWVSRRRNNYNHSK